MKAKLLISACLMGQKVRYDGGGNDQESEPLKQLQAKNLLFPFCPEMAGGLGVPRKPCEIISTNPWKVVDTTGVDCTDAFVKGAMKAVELVKTHQIKVAILKERSPSCGTRQIYDGNFNRTKIEGMGLTSFYLKQAGVQLFNENEINEAIACFWALDSGF